MKSLDRVSEAFRVGRGFTAQLSEHRSKLILAGLLALLSAGLEILRPWPIQYIFDHALGVGEPAGTLSTQSIIWLGGLAALIIALVRSFADYHVTLKLTEAGHGVTRSIRLRIFSHLAELSPRFHREHKAGDLLVRLMGDVPMLRTMLVDSTMMLATRAVLVVGTAGVMFIVDPLLAVLIVCIMPLLAVVVRLLAKKVTIAVRKQRRKEGDMADFLHEAIEAAPLIQALGQSRETVRRFARSNRSSARAGMKAARAAARLSVTVEGVLGVALAVTLGLGALRVRDGHLSPGELLVFLSYVRSVSKPIRSAAKHSVKVAKGTACGERILAVLNEREQVRASAGSEVPPAQPKQLVFRDVSYSYGTQPALSDVNLQLNSGQLTTLFGPSGAGKSTLMSLALRLFDPTQGHVELDGVDVRSCDLDKLRQRFALSTQDTVLFGESIRENLLLGRLDATDEELLAALDQASALDLIVDRSEGLDTVLGAGGSGFSGGERKRLCLARALLREAPILIVDEPFSGLDRTSADRVARTLRSYAAEHMVLAVSHEVERLPEFDRVIFIEDGCIAGDGTHAALLANTQYASACAGERGESA